MSQINNNNNNNLAYQNIPSEQYWPPTSGYRSTPDHARRNRLLKIGGIVLGVLAVLGIVIGVVVSQVSGKNHGSSGGKKGSVAAGGNENDASEFEKDSRLHDSFWGFAYTPQVSYALFYFVLRD
jgi:glucan 1,3-beta-glucosidase